MKRICCFCGSSLGNDPAFKAAAAELGQELGRRGVGVVYGGGRLGVMGALADAALAAGAEVIGVLPRALFGSEVVHEGLTTLHEVGSLHERKARMAELADAFVVLPGGLGTLDEWFEVWTWAQLGVHRKPLALLNVRGYFDPLLAFVEDMVREGFATPTHRDLVHVSTEVRELLDRLAWVSSPRSPEPGAPPP
jgi:uncharacterized protein (TIGR00730 family)